MRARLEPQPDDAVPRFAYEEHLKSLSGPDRRWPQSTRRIAQLRLTIEFESAAGWGARRSTPQARYRRLSRRMAARPAAPRQDLRRMVARDAGRKPKLRPARRWRTNGARRWSASTRRPRPTRTTARRIAELFTAYLKRARDDVYALSTLPPGRFLMPGDLAGSPALTFAPIPLGDDAAIASGSLAAMMARRYEAYKAHVARPFFRDHFARLDRQIVLVDALSALNSGPAALKRSRERADRGHARLPRRTRVSSALRSSVPASTASCSRRPRPTICITRATTGWRRSCAR